MAPQLSLPVVPAPQQSALQQQRGQGPQVDTVLQGRIQAAQQAAQLQRPCIDRLIAKLTRPLPRTSASLSHDLQPLAAQSAEYKELSALMADVQAPVHSISRVIVPEREARIRAWKGTLPAHFQSTTRVSKSDWATLTCKCSAKLGYILPCYVKLCCCDSLTQLN